MHRLALLVGGPVMTVMYVVGWLVFARMFPAPSPGLTAQQLADWIVAHKPGMTMGCLFMIAATGIWGSWVAAISVWTFRTEARFPVLTFTQLICVGCGLTFFVFDTLFWSVATFRAGETDPAVTQQMWDVGWFGFLCTITAYVAWAVAWCLGVLCNPPDHQVFPRWTAFVTLGSVMCWIPGLFTMFFKEGPFTYNGPTGMWLPIIEFFVWLIILDVYARKAVRRQEALSRQEGLERGPAYGLYPPENIDELPHFTLIGTTAMSPYANGSVNSRSNGHAAETPTTASAESN